MITVAWLKVWMARPSFNTGKLQGIYLNGRRANVVS